MATHFDEPFHAVTSALSSVYGAMLLAFVSSYVGLLPVAGPVGAVILLGLAPIAWIALPLVLLPLCSALVVVCSPLYLPERPGTTLLFAAINAGIWWGVAEYLMRH